MTTIIVDAHGVRPDAEVGDVQAAVASGGFFWLDIVGEGEAAVAALMKAAAFDDAEIAAAVRFRQTGRMRFGRDRLRFVTWIADPDGALIEFHLIGFDKRIVTLWNGDPASLDTIRRQFSYRIAGIGGDMPYATGLLLQLLIGTLDALLQKLDAEIDQLRMNLDRQSYSMDSSLITQDVQQLQSFAAGFSRYTSAVRSAMVGVESLPGVGARAAEELNDYVDLVEDFEEQLFERRRWLSDITHDFANAIAQRQSEQISRLTIVSMIFLPVTALTGFFGMNFAWLSEKIASEESFFVFGLLLPALGMILTVAWLARRGLMRLDLWR